jgi:hypothetical protein
MTDANIVGPAPVAGRETTVIVGMHDRPYIDWPAVIGGVFVAVVLWMLLTSFGASVGLFLAPPWGAIESSITTLTIAAAAWFAIVQLFSAVSGAYMAGRMRHRVDGGPQNEVAFRDGANGLLVWAVGFVLAGFIGVSAGLLGMAAVGSSSGANATPLSNIEATDQLFRPKMAESGQADDTDQAASASITILPARRGQPLNRDEVSRILDDSVSSGDRAYLAALVAARTNLNVSEARDRVNTVIAERKVAYEKSRKTAALLGFWTAVSLLISGAASWWAAGIGGRHRDDFK